MKPTLLLLCLSFILLVLVSGCLEETEEIISSSAALSLDSDKIELQNGSVSDFVSATVTRKDDNDESLDFTIKFPDTFEGAYPVDAEGNKIQELQISNLVGKGAKKLAQFKVKGELKEGESITYELNLELWQGDNQIKSQTKKLDVVVKA